MPARRFAWRAFFIGEAGRLVIASALDYRPRPAARSHLGGQLIICAPLPGQAAEPDNSALIGTWTLTKVLDSSGISSIDDAQAAALVGKTLIIAPDRVTVAGESCRRAPRFTRHYEDAAQYIRESAHAPVGRLGIPTVVEAVDLSCTEALIKGYDQIVIFWKGFFFDAVRKQAGQ